VVSVQCINGFNSAGLGFSCIDVAKDTHPLFSFVNTLIQNTFHTR
jgi:hypothetical protein